MCVLLCSLPQLMPQYRIQHSVSAAILNFKVYVLWFVQHINAVIQFLVSICGVGSRTRLATIYAAVRYTVPRQYGVNL